MIYSERVRAALRFAERAHRGQQRKGGDEPYVLHAITVAMLLAANGADEDLVCAAYLHDTVEDVGVDLEEIASSFGDEVAELVRAVTEDRLRSWHDRKTAMIDHLAEAPQNVLALKAADVCTNITDVVLDHRQIGDDVWLRFRRGAGQQQWYYTTVADTVLRRLQGFEGLRAELESRVEELRAISRRRSSSAGSSPGRG